MVINAIKNEQPTLQLKLIPDVTYTALRPINNILTYRTYEKNDKKDITIQYSLSDKQKDLKSIPENIYSMLYPFQREGIKFGIRNYARILIGDEMVYKYI